MDSERCDLRDRAARRIKQLVAQPELSKSVAVELRKALIAPGASFELRARLTPILASVGQQQLPATQVDLAEIPRLVAQLEDDSFGQRQSAAQRLAWAIGDPAAICPTLAPLRAMLANPDLEPALRRELLPLWKKVRAAWLASDPAIWQLPPISDEQIAAWIAVLRKPLPRTRTGEAQAERETARRELLDLLARDEYVPKVKALLTAELTDPLDSTTFELRELNDWTLPGLVAEIWDTQLQGTAITTVQYLALGVPCQPEGAERPSLFDKADDQKAHCVSGNSLSPGDWPVGIAFPNPIAEDKFFHLVNLPTPRHRLAYEANVDSDERERLKRLTQRTLKAVLTDARPLTFAETYMLDKLDTEEVSKFVGPYFSKVDDQLYPPDVRHTPSGRASLHQTICIGLAQHGTREAIPGLMQAIEKKRFLEPQPGSSFDWPWISALSIAVHDPWPDVERWLVEQIERTDPLAIRLEGQEASPTPDVGATAAAILLARHDLPPWAFRLERIWQPPIDNFDIPCCRAISADDRQAIVAWWKKLAGAAESDGGAAPRSAAVSP